MALQTFIGGLVTPDISGLGIIPTFTQMLIDASGEKAAVIFRVPKTGTLDKAEFRVGTATLNAASQIRVSFQDVSDVNGDPDGTQDQFRDIAGSSFTSNAWTVPGLMTSDGTDTGVKRSVTRGDLLSVVVEYSTFTAADILNVSTLTATGSGTSAAYGQAYPDLFTAAWVKQALYPIVALKYDDGAYVFISTNIYPIETFNAVSFNSGSTPDERGLIFQFPSAVKVGGAWLICDLDAVADVVLYDSDGTTALETVSLDPDQRQAANARVFFMRFPTDRELSASTNYRLIAKPTSVSGITIYDFDIDAVALMDAVEGGQNWHYTQRTDAGAWSQTTTKRPWMGCSW